MIGRALGYLFLPGEGERWPEGRLFESLRVVRTATCLMFLVTNSLLALSLRGSAEVHGDVLMAWTILVCSTVGVDAVVTWWFRKPSRAWRVAVSVVSLGDVLTLLVWMQLTGTVSSYFTITPVVFGLLFRLLYGYGLGLATFLLAEVVFLACFGLEQTGHLPVASLYVEPPGGAYATESYRQMAATSIFLVFLVAFALANATAKFVRGNVLELERAQAKVRDLIERARLGRLSGRVFGSYQIGELLGRGGMGEVYAARRGGDGREVAIKILHAHLGDDKTARDRFRLEARVGRELPPSTVAEVFEVGTTEAGDEFIAMERLRGEDMAALLRRRDRLGLAEVVPMVERIAVALDAAHALGIVHRDLKPQNLFVCAERLADGGPDVRLLDFGIARLHELAAASGITATAVVVGTPGYIAPEVATGGGRAAGPPADVFALGALVYRLLTGMPAFPARDLSAALVESVSLTPPPPSRVVADVPPAIDAVIARALEKDPARRWPRAGDLARALGVAETERKNAPGKTLTEVGS